MQGEGQICLPVYDGVALKIYKTLIPLSLTEPGFPLSVPSAPSVHRCFEELPASAQCQWVGRLYTSLHDDLPGIHEPLGSGFAAGSTSPAGLIWDQESLCAGKGELRFTHPNVLVSGLMIFTMAV